MYYKPASSSKCRLWWLWFVAHALERAAFTLPRNPRALCGRLPTCGRLGAPSGPGLLWGSQSYLQAALFVSRFVGFCRKRRSRQGSPVARVNALRSTRATLKWPRARLPTMMLKGSSLPGRQHRRAAVYDVFAAARFHAIEPIAIINRSLQFRGDLPVDTRRYRHQHDRGNLLYFLHEPHVNEPQVEPAITEGAGCTSGSDCSRLEQNRETPPPNRDCAEANRACRLPECH